MSYFTNIQSLSELKSQYRKLVLANHPDKGGDTKAMQAINDEFEQLFKLYKDSKPTETTPNGYENDFNEARTAQEYANHVYEEYGWTGSNYFTHDNSKIVAILREWLKKTYPEFTFTVNKKGYNSINIHIMTMDFCPWKDGEIRRSYDNRRSNIDLTERAQDVLNNIERYMNSFNYDHSDYMTDYFDRNFYGSIKFGNDRTPFKVETVRSRRMAGDAPKEFKWKEGPAHKLLKKTLGSLSFGYCRWGRNEGKLILGRYEVDRYGDGENGFVFRANDYSQPSIIKKKIQQLTEAGILCEKSFCNILFKGYSPEMEKALAAEDTEKEEAFKQWQQEQNRTMLSQKKEEEEISPKTEGSNIRIIDYSEKAIAVIGDTKSIANILRELGGRFNSHLSCGAGWVFSKKKQDEVRKALAA